MYSTVYITYTKPKLIQPQGMLYNMQGASCLNFKYYSTIWINNIYINQLLDFYKKHEIE